MRAKRRIDRLCARQPIDDASFGMQVAQYQNLWGDVGMYAHLANQLSKARLRLVFIFALMGLSICFTSPASAECQNAREVCDAINWCLRNPDPRNATNRERLEDSTARGVWSEIEAWTTRCQRDLGSTWNDYSRASGGCTSNNWVDQGQRAHSGVCADLPAKRAYCYTQGGYYELGHLGPPGTGPCNGQADEGAACRCGSSPGVVHLR